MRRVSCLTWGLCVACLVVVGCQRANNAPSPQAALDGDALAAANLTIGEPIRHANLTIFPVTSKTARDEDRFITLDEGVKSQTVEVYEMGAYPAARANRVDRGEQDASNPEGQQGAAAAETQQAAQPAQASNLAQTAANPPAADPFVNDDQQQSGPDVNRVLVLNKSSQPLYLMPGETILGGQQDRTIAQETIVPPGERPIEVAVFCVEHGRWHDRSAAETVRLATAARGAGEIVPHANHLSLVVSQTQAFVPGAGNLGKEARLAVQADKSQTKVWDEVAKANKSADLVVETGAFTANYGDEENLKRLEPYQQAFADQVAADDRIVGVIVAINGRVQSVDVFESTPLFRKLWPKLLRSYALDAANTAEEADADKAVKLADAQSFLDQTMNGQLDETKTEGGLVLTSRQSQEVVSFSISETAALHDRGESAAQPAAPGDESGRVNVNAYGGYGGGVHVSGFSKP